MEHNNSSGCGGLCCTKIENFSVSIGGTEILTDINLHIHCGELTALIGRNGAGKSTLLRTILGEVPHSGTLRYCDVNNNITVPSIGYIPQNLNFDINMPINVFDLFLGFNAALPACVFRAASARDLCLERLGIVKAEHLIDKKIGSLSGGELQRVMLALALTPIPNLLLLDEPVSGVDVAGMKLFYELLTELKKKYDLSIILISHDLDLVKAYADRVILLDKKVIACGKPQEVISNSER